MRNKTWLGVALKEGRRSRRPERRQGLPGAQTIFTSPPWLLCLALAPVVAAGPLLAAEHSVSTPAELAALPALEPGDVVVLRDGTWKDAELILRGKGSEIKPITFRAETPGQVILTGKSAVRIGGEYVVVSGLCVKDGSAAGDGITLQGTHCRLTETAVVDSTYKFYVHLFGTENRMDHCFLAGKTSESPTLQIEAEGTPNHHRIDHNHFGHRPPLGRNGGETIRVGYSGQSMNDSQTTVENNLFDRCDGELEIISNKSCGNLYRGNTFRDCAGMFTLRHGNRCRVEGNFFFGNHKPGAGGIRVIGEDHVVVNNYFEGLSQGAFWVTSGIPNSPLNGYFCARNCLIAFNTVVDSRGPCVEVAAGLGTSGRTLLPEGITVANNLFAVPADGELIRGTREPGFHWSSNFATKGFAEHAGVKLAEVPLEKLDGLYRPTTSCPVRGAADGGVSAVTTDIDGQPRTAPTDAGCDQASTAPVTNRPLTAADVGPAWLKDRGI